MAEFIPVNVPVLDGNEGKYLSECIETGWISSEGPFVDKFEKRFSEKVSRQYGVAVSSGSAALDVAVAALGLGKGDEVILPAHTIISCAASVVRCGATPVLVDSDFQTWNMDPARIEEKITKRTKAIMIVHVYGLPSDMDPILALAKDHSLFVIEDAAEMIGQTYNGKPCGSFGDISIVSFYPNKHVTSGEGGMCLTNDLELAERCRSFKNLCFQARKRFIHEELGWNYRMTNMQAAVGLAQLERLDEHIERKRAIGRKYHNMLADINSLVVPLVKTEFAENIYWVFGLVVVDKNISSEWIMRELTNKGVGCRPFFWPMNKQPVFQKMGLFLDEEYPVAERLGEQGFYIPSGLALTDDEIERVSVILRGILSNV